MHFWVPLKSIYIGDSVTWIGYNAFQFAFLEEAVSISKEAKFDLSIFPDSVEIIVRDDANIINIINSVPGKGKLRGTEVADRFTFDDLIGYFGRKHADKIIGFDSSQGDTIGISAGGFPWFDEDEISFASASSKKELKSYSKQDIDFVYFESKGRLFFNGNGVEKGWGDSFEGGLFAILKGKPELSEADFTILA